MNLETSDNLAKDPVNPYISPIYQQILFNSSLIGELKVKLFYFMLNFYHKFT